MNALEAGQLVSYVAAMDGGVRTGDDANAAWAAALDANITLDEARKLVDTWYKRESVNGTHNRVTPLGINRMFQSAAAPDSGRQTDFCSEGGFGDFLVANEVFDQSADLQWRLHRTYWQNKANGHRLALRACMEYARQHGVTCTLYTDPETKRKLEARP